MQSNVLAASMQVHVVCQSDAASVIFVNMSGFNLSCEKPSSIANLQAHTISQQQLASVKRPVSAVLNAKIWERVARQDKVTFLRNKRSAIQLRLLFLSSAQLK